MKKLIAVILTIWTADAMAAHARVLKTIHCNLQNGVVVDQNNEETNLRGDLYVTAVWGVATREFSTYVFGPSEFDKDPMIELKETASVFGDAMWASTYNIELPHLDLDSNSVQNLSGIVQLDNQNSVAAKCVLQLMDSQKSW